MSFPRPPEKIVPFNSGPVAAHDIGRQFDEHRRGISSVIDFLRTIFRDDGVVRESSMPARAAGTAGAARAADILGGSKEPTLPVGVLGPGAGGFYAGDDKGATATSADYAQVSIDWAEHMPDTIPNQTMAVMAITGQHWSSRWWANQAALSAGQIVGNYLPLSGGQMTGPLVIPQVANLSVGGGATGQVLTTVGSGNLGWSTPSGTFIDAPSNNQYYSRYNGGWVVSPGGLTDAPNDGTLYARKSQAWSHLTHADITDWSSVLSGYATTGSVPLASTATPLMNGVAAVGVGTTWARADHVHPSDTSRLAMSGGTLTGALLMSGAASTITLAADPAAPLQASTKQYVDAHVSYGDNRIINGDMRIDQRNNGASGAATGYTVDRWAYNATQAGKGTWQRSPGPANSGFPYCLGVFSSSAYASLASDTFAFTQPIEADLISDFAWGTSAAQAVTLSFWAFSSLTGTFSGSIRNFAGARSYPFSFSLPTASTWTRIVITIPGDTAGTWVMSGNGGAAVVAFDLGSGANSRAAAGAWASGNYLGVTGAVSVVATNAATFYVTGVKLEIGSVATAFNRYSLAKSMADCQRYYALINPVIASSWQAVGQTFYNSMALPVFMRAAPTALVLGTPSYTNASGFTLLQMSNSGFAVSAAAIAAGYALANGVAAFSAEL